MDTTLYRIIKHGFQSFWRQRLLSVATLTVMLLALLVFESLVLFNVVAQAALASVQDKIDVSVYFKTEAPEDEILRVKRLLEKMEEVKSVDYVSRDKALEIFHERHKEDTTITQALDELGENPLLASLSVRAHDPNEYSVIAAYLDNGTLGELVEKVDYYQNEVVIHRLASIVGISRQAGVLLTIVLTVVAVLVAFNTILLAIHSNREEIEVMRLVGASNTFIQGPYIVEGVVYGVVAAVVSIGVAAPVTYFISPYLQVFIPGVNLASYFTANLASLFAYQTVFGIGIGVVSSLIAVRKYLKV